VFAATALDRDHHLADPRSMRIRIENASGRWHIAALCDEVRDATEPAGRITREGRHHGHGRRQMPTVTAFR